MATGPALTLHFWKMHGAGNDFVLFDDRQGTFPVDDPGWRRHLADRTRGIGSDGVILLQSTTRADVAMRFFNPDGKEAEMCGNGLRCAARLASHLGIAGDQLQILTAVGPRAACVRDDSVEVGMGTVHNAQFDQALQVDERTLRYDFLNTGVPHVVIQLSDAMAVSEDAMLELAPRVRNHPHFAPAGTNVNIVALEKNGTVVLRTYERGVEAETLACGTGATAAAIASAHHYNLDCPVRVRTQGGDMLHIDFAVTDSGFEDVTLTGPAVFVFEGDIVYEDRNV